MKKLLSIIIGMTLSLTAFCQYSNPIEYPRYEKDSNGQDVVVITIQQAQTLDNNMELLGLLEQLNSQLQNSDSVCIKVINDKDQVISSQKMEIQKLKESLDNKDQQISALQGEIAGYLKKIMVLEDQVENRQNVIDEKNLQLRKAKTKMVIGGIGGTAIIIGLIVSIITHH
jgi:predicted RNase H-like nuclease (RuvC/YqgF family)